jgi:hypothetical protein
MRAPPDKKRDAPKSAPNRTDLVTTTSAPNNTGRLVEAHATSLVGRDRIDEGSSNATFRDDQQPTAPDPHRGRAPGRTAQPRSGRAFVAGVAVRAGSPHLLRTERSPSARVVDRGARGASPIDREAP